MSQTFKKLFCLLLALLFAAAPIAVLAEDGALSAASDLQQQEADAEEERKDAEEERSRLLEITELLNSITYRTYRLNHEQLPLGKDTVHIEAADFQKDTTSADLMFAEDVADSAGVVEPGTSICIPEEGNVSWSFTIPEDGMYAIRLRYLSVAEFSDGETTVHGYTSAAERGLMVDGKYPFKESRYLQFPRVWQDEYAIDENGVRQFEHDDTSDSELRPSKVETPRWETIYAMDSTGYYMESFSYYLEAGEHTVTLAETQEPLMLRWIEFTAPQRHKTYEQVLAEYESNGYTAAEVEPENYPKIDAEKPDYTAAQVVYAVNDRTSAITEPQDPATLMLNTIGGEKWNTVGQWVEWTVEIPEDGLYYIVPRAMQNVYDGVYSSRSLMIDGEIPFYEATFLQFSFSNEWKVEPLKTVDGTPIEFYFTRGTHTLRMNVVLGEMGEVLAQVETVMNTMNSYYLDILKLTGSDPDTYRDYEFSKLMPEVLEGMVDLSVILNDIAAQLSAINGYTGEKLVTLTETAMLLESMGKDEYEIAANFSNLNDKVSALGTWITDTRYQPLQIDYFLFTPAKEDVELPRAEADFWESFAFEFRAFLVSFFTDYNSMTQKDDENTSHEAVVIWMTTGRDQAQIIRSMVSDMFTARTNIPINLKLVAGGLLQATLAGVGPDISLTNGSDGVIQYAIRNACINVEHMEGFDEVCTWFTRAAMIPLTLYGKTYGLPETQSFAMLFYRKDVLADLEIEIPKTWEDIYSIIPILQNNNMQIAVPSGTATYLYQRYASDVNYRDGDEYQIGYPYENGYRPGALVDDAIYVMPDGTMFNLNYGMQVNLDGQNALSCFKQMCEFFTLYSFPIAYNFTNRFRTGEMPMGVEGYGLYSTLMVTAPELRGLWEFTTIPGTYNTNEDGSVTLNCRNSAGVSAIMMVRGCGDDVTEEGKRIRSDAWEFMKFWVNAEAQGRYGNELLALLGASGRHATANLEALRSQPWPAQDRKNLEAAFEWVMATYEMPGGYISARYVQFAFLNVYNDAAAPIPSLLEYIDLINAELTRKRREFDLPTLDNYETFDYEAYFAENYKKENQEGGHILETLPTA